ncbi:MAG: shikimate kinase, partial [Proteobacteria bacterium]|nr:shikimate kinase [Pseudomonadota bacterium]
MHRIKNVSFIGMAGCGKSTIGKALSKNLGINFTDTDLLIEEKFKASLEQIKKNNGYKFVRRAEEEVILSLDKHIKIISTGGSAVYSEKSMFHLSSFSKIVYINTPL